MTAITALIFTDAEAWLKENLPDMEVDGIAAVYRTELAKNGNFDAVYYDEEERQYKNVTLADQVKALELLVQLVGDKKLFVGGIENPIDLVDLCNWDVEVVDAYFQLLYHGEVIYG